MYVRAHVLSPNRMGKQIRDCGVAIPFEGVQWDVLTSLSLSESTCTL